MLRIGEIFYGDKVKQLAATNAMQELREAGKHLLTKVPHFKIAETMSSGITAACEHEVMSSKIDAIEENASSKSDSTNRGESGRDAGTVSEPELELDDSTAINASDVKLLNESEEDYLIRHCR